MSPDKKKEVKGLKVTQFYWAGKDVVYIDNRATESKYDDITENTIDDIVKSDLSKRIGPN